MNHDWWSAFSPFTAWAQAAAPFAAPGSPLPGAAPWASLATAAERFAAAFQRYAADASRDPAGAASALSEFLRDQSLDLLRTSLSGGTVGAGGEAAAFAIPALGLTREHQERAQRAAAAANRMAEAQRRLAWLWTDALRDAATQFVAALASASTPSAGPAAAPDARELYQRWVDTAEKAYAQVAHGEAFAAALGEFVNASARLRDEWQDMVEHWAKSIDLPTRSELDTLGERLRAVEARLRDLHAPAAKRAPAKPGNTASRARRGKRRSPQ